MIESEWEGPGRSLNIISEVENRKTVDMGNDTEWK